MGGRPATIDEYDKGQRLKIHTRELEHSIQMGWIEDSRPHLLPNQTTKEDWRFPGVVGWASVQQVEERRNQDDHGRPLSECLRRADEGASWLRPPVAMGEGQRDHQLGRPSVMKYGPDVLAAIRAGGRGQEVSIYFLQSSYIVLTINVRIYNRLGYKGLPEKVENFI